VAPPPAILDQADDQAGEAQQQQAQQAPQTPPVLPLPPIPALTDLPKGTAPPVPVIGVLSVQDVMRQSTAAQQVEKILGARRDKLNQDAQKEQASWRDLQQQIQNAKGAPDQLQTREHALQARVVQAQRDFRNRNRILQEAAQVSLGQVERELVQVIRQVASSRGMNLVLHREQVALNVNDFDITLQVANQLNSTLNSVFIPGDGVDPEVLAKSGAFPTTANPGPQPAAPVSSIAAATPAPAAAVPAKK
jgi:Skp family chaperone for outer membrane proteins